MPHGSASIDYSKAVEAAQGFASGKKRAINLAYIDKVQPRDDFMYRQTDALFNVGLDNTKEKSPKTNEKPRLRRGEWSALAWRGPRLTPPSASPP